MTARVRSRRSRLRTRVVAAAAVSIVVAVVVLGGAVQVLLSRHLHQALDHTLRDQAAQVAELAATAPGLLTSPAAVNASAESGRLDVEVVDRHGRVVSPPTEFGGARLSPGPLLLAAIRHGRSGYRDAMLAGRRARLYVAPLADVGGPASGGAVIVASTTDEIDSTLAESRTLIIASALAAALLVAPIAFILTGRALRPLATLAAGAEVIERRGDPSLRLPGASGDGHTPDEVARLADTLNRMLAALERAREGERRFVADASHELRNPLAALRGNAEYLARHGSDQEALDDLRTDAERLSRLVDELLRLAHEDAAEVPDEPVRLDELALAVAGDRVAVRVTDPGLVRGDGAALDRALRNLIENAVGHGPADGPVEVIVERRGDEVRLTVSDTGAGIPPELVEAATTRFWRGEDARSKPGSGLGLALVRATAERHGGRLEIDGARVMLVLPALTRLSSDRGTTPSDKPEGA
jgi:two-component system, OmpR family, sensor kinase